MENTALNGTTNATKDHEEWKKKKGYGPILVVAVSLALLLSLYAGGYLRSGTNLPPSLHRDEKGMTNAVASSSSTSLVGSGTAQGGSSSRCDGFGCIISAYVEKFFNEECDKCLNFFENAQQLTRKEQSSLCQEIVSLVVGNNDLSEEQEKDGLAYCTLVLMPCASSTATPSECCQQQSKGLCS